MCQPLKGSGRARLDDVWFTCRLSQSCGLKCLSGSWPTPLKRERGARAPLQRGGCGLARIGRLDICEPRALEP